MPIIYMRPKEVRMALEDLSENEQLLLWAMRTWVQGFMCDIPVARSIITGLHRLNAKEVLREIDGLMALYGSAAVSTPTNWDFLP